jgi:radical SAM additional 4Fe4S-binding domain
MNTDEFLTKPKTEPPLRRFLLNRGDYIVINSGESKYLFLSKTLRYFKITNAYIKKYLRLCETEGYGSTSLTEGEVKSIGNFLTTDDFMDTTEDSLSDDGGHNFLILNLTGGCNLACKYCFAEITKSYNTMSLDVAKKAITNMLNQEKDIDEYSIFFFGGEPLLKKDLIKQIVEFAYDEIAVKESKKVKFLINTNATLIEENIIQLFKKYDFTVTVSLDGPMEYHDRNRVYINGKGSFERVATSVEMLKKNNIQTNLRATFCPDTQDLVSNFKFFESMKIPYAYSFTINSEYKMNLKDTFFEEDQFEAIESEMRKVMDFFFDKIRRVETIYYTGLNRKLSMLRYKKKRAYSCEAGRRSITVDEQGNYYACQNMIPYKQTIMGSVDQGISNDKKMQFHSKELRLLNECHSCAIRNLCAGGCSAERYNPNSKTKRQMCRLFNIEWKNLLYLFALIIETKKK